MANPMLRDGGFFAARHPIPANVAFLEMSDVGGQDVALIFPRGEAGPGMRSIVGRMGPAVHVNGPVDRAQPFGMPRDDFAGSRVYFLPDAEVGRPTPNVIRAVGAALPFGQG